MSTLSTFSMPLRRAAARCAGALYLLTMGLAVVSEMILKPRFVASGDPALWTQQLLAEESIYRAALVCNLLTALGVTGLIACLYVVLRPAHAPLATVGAMFRLIENALTYVPVVFGALALWFLRDIPYLEAFDLSERYVLARFFLHAQTVALPFAFVPCGVGAAVFALAWHRSGYVPRWIAIYGFCAALLLTASVLTHIVQPAVGPYLLGLMMPLGIFEISFGCFLLAGRARIP